MWYESVSEWSRRESNTGSAFFIPALPRESTKIPFHTHTVPFLSLDSSRLQQSFSVPNEKITYPFVVVRLIFTLPFFPGLSCSTHCVWKNQNGPAFNWNQTSVLVWPTEHSPDCGVHATVIELFVVQLSEKREQDLDAAYRVYGTVDGVGDDGLYILWATCGLLALTEIHNRTHKHLVFYCSACSQIGTYFSLSVK